MSPHKRGFIKSVLLQLSTLNLTTHKVSKTKEMYRVDTDTCNLTLTFNSRVIEIYVWRYSECLDDCRERALFQYTDGVSSVMAEVLSVIREGKQTDE